MFPEVQIFNTDDANPEPARCWLEALPVNAATDVVISYRNDLAVLTTWTVFCRFWDDLCYAGINYVLLWSVNNEGEHWALAYFHEDELLFGRADG